MEVKSHMENVTNHPCESTEVPQHIVFEESNKAFKSSCLAGVEIPGAKSRIELHKRVNVYDRNWS